MSYDEFTAKMVKRVGELEQALAEKDRECGLMDDELHLLLHLLRQKHKDYQQLMEQAVRFARYIKDEFTYDDDPRFVEAEAFLKERRCHDGMVQDPPQVQRETYAE